MAIIMMTSEEVTYEELVEYFEGGRKVSINDKHKLFLDLIKYYE